MSVENRTSLNDQISREAAEWLVEFRTGEIDAAGRREFDAWLRASPGHVRAFIEMAAIWHEGGAIDPPRRLDVEAILARGRMEENIADLTPAARGGALEARGNATSRQRRTLPWAIAASLLVAAGAALYILSIRSPGEAVYATAVGARRSIALPDGSKVLLDSKSRLRVSYTTATRRVDLLQGQALFYVAKDPQRPFLVHAGRAVVRDVGTVFDVNRLRDNTVVTVVEGSVAVAMPSEPVYLAAGEQLSVYIGNFSPGPIHVDVSSETAWTRGQVVLESATLTEIAQAFTRYSTRRLVARDLGKKPLLLSGVFSTDPRFLIGYLRARPDVVVRETASEIDIVRSPCGYRSACASRAVKR